MKRSIVWLLLMAMGFSHVGCHHHYASITAVGLSPLNQGEPEGIPYYLPKPLLVIAKNVRHIDESKVGLNHPPPIPNAFDNQASYADVKANVTAPGDGSKSVGAIDAGQTKLPEKFDDDKRGIPDIWERLTPKDRINDGIAPDSFYTYQIVMVPDLSQKYGLRIRGGPGEIRAAMNLVNGWMYTGMGPFYLKDSSTAQNHMAFGVGAMFAGRGASDVLNEVSSLARVGGAGKTERAPGEGPVDSDDYIDRVTDLARALQSQTRVPQTMLNYSEIFIYEPSLSPDGSTQWSLIAHHQFDRHYFAPDGDRSTADVMRTILGLQNAAPRAPEPAENEKQPASDKKEGASQGKGSSLPGKKSSVPSPPAARPVDEPAPAPTAAEEPPPPSTFPALDGPSVQLRPLIPMKAGATIQD